MGGWDASRQISPTTPVQMGMMGVGQHAPIQSNIYLNNQSGVIGDAGAVTRSVPIFGQGTSFGPTSTNVQTGVGPNDFSMDRMRVEEALYNRLNPQLGRQREALESQLVNQGYQRGSQAWNEAMDESNRQANDARYGAIREGGAEQTRQLQSALAQGQFANAAQQQEYGEQLGRGQFYNAATAANNAANLAGGQFWNQAQQQTFAQNQAQQQAIDTATAANNQARIAEGTFGRESQAQGFTQDIANAQLYNASAAQNNAANLQANQFLNAAQQQNFDQDVARRSADNAVMQQVYGNQLNLLGAQNAQRQAYIQEMLQQRNQPINEISALMGGGQVQMPQFSQYQPGNIAGTPVGEYYYQTDAANRDNYKTQVQFQAAQTQAMYGLAGAALGGLFRFSDRRLKRDVIDLGIELINGIKLYSYRLLDEIGARIGVMADEVMQVKPDAVYLTPTGFLAVDYGEIV
jgi:hypothetical protein